MNPFIRSAIFAIALACTATSQSQAQDAKPSAQEAAQARGYLIANFDILEPATFQKYLAEVGPIGQKYKLKVVVFNVKSRVVEGSPKSVSVVVEFPSLADAERFYFSPEYAEVKKLRIASTSGTVILSEGAAPPQQ